MTPNCYNHLGCKKGLMLLLVITIAPAYFLLQVGNTYAQGGKTMSPEVYSQWSRIRSQAMSDSGQVAIYQLERETGNKMLNVYDARKDVLHTFDRVNEALLDAAGRFVAMRRVADDDKIRELKRKKTEKDKMPPDTLGIFMPRTGSIAWYPNLESFKTPARYGRYLAAAFNRPEEKKEGSRARADQRNREKSFMLVVYDMAKQHTDTLLHVTDYVFAENGPRLAFVRSSRDTLNGPGVYVFDPISRAVQQVLPSKAKIANLTFDKSGKLLAFTADTDTTKNPVRYVDLYLNEGNQTRKIADRSSDFLPDEWLISPTGRITFSETGKRLFFGGAPTPLVQDTTKLEDEIVQVEIWHYDDQRLYTQANASLERDQRRSYRFFFDIHEGKFYQLENKQFGDASIAQKNEGMFVLTTDINPYQKAATWEGGVSRDIYITNLATGARTLVASNQTDNPSLSLGGKYIIWYNRRDSLWKAYDIQASKLVELTGKKGAPFWDEENDEPQPPGSYGIAGWTKNDEFVLINDRYDLWLIDPNNPSLAKRLTRGRENRDRFRYIQTNAEREFIDLAEPLLLINFNEGNKTEYYVSYTHKTGAQQKLFGGAMSLQSNITRARKSNHILFTFQDFHTFPDLFYTTLAFKTPKRISDANPQQKEYAWGSIRLFEWKNFDGRVQEGLLCLPANFDPAKKYPLIVNFYERSSDGLYRYRAPEAGRSTISYSYYANKGYVIFNPDVYYTVGYPGKSAYDAVMSGVDALLALGFVDSTRMALHGHSWGAYQVAYILTQTNRFRCAEAGAPVVNMVSAYGGIRWETGASRMFQYERTQSRLGPTLWENPKLYLENSPIFYMDRVTTPVLILHNDADGAVPWYQGIEYYMALRRLGKPAWMLNYNKEPHWPVKWQNRLDFNIRLEQFFDHYLMNKPMPRWMKEGMTPIEKGIVNKYELDHREDF